jgi:hypothetical protein
LLQGRDYLLENPRRKILLGLYIEHEKENKMTYWKSMPTKFSKKLLLQIFHLFHYSCGIAGLGRFRIDDGRIKLVVVFPPPANVCVPSSNSLLEVGISIKGVTP